VTETEAVAFVERDRPLNVVLAEALDRFSQVEDESLRATDRRVQRLFAVQLLKGNLAAMLRAARNAKRSPETATSHCKLMVTGVRNQRYLWLWSGAA
jgi:hypothetical protein